MFLKRFFAYKYPLLLFSNEIVRKRFSKNLWFIVGAYRQISSLGIRVIRSSPTAPTTTTLAFIAFTKASPTKKQLQESMTDESSLDLDTVLQSADQLFDQNHYQEVIEVLAKYPDQNSPEIKWRKSRTFYSLAKSVQDEAERAKLIRDSYALIESALEADETNFAIHKWMAIVLDANAELDGYKARILQLENVKKHMSKAVELNPEDPTSWYLIGSFEFGLADLSWVQRKIVIAIFATPPTGSYEKALECFERAESIKPGFFSSNWLMVGKCYMALNNRADAKLFLEKAANCQVLNEDDKKSKEEATRLLKQL